MSDGRDVVIDKVRAALRASPEAEPDPRAVGRLLATVWDAPRPSALRRWLDAWRVPALSGLGASAVAAAALLVGFVTRGAVGERPGREPMAATGEFPTPEAAGPAAAPTMLVADARDDAALVPTQFVLDRAGAASVALVGDFNGWQGGTHPLTRLESGLWTATVALPAGRHVYAFLVDGTLVVADPRAPKSGDADYGREGSVVMVFAR